MAAPMRSWYCGAFLACFVGAALAGSRRQDGAIPRYRWDGAWPASKDLDFGSTHGGMVFDARGRLIVSSDSAPYLRVLSPSGELLERWGEDLGPGAHGLCMTEREGTAHLYVAHTQRHAVLVYDLQGKLAREIDWPKESGRYAAREEFQPTSVAVADDGSCFVADGYGKSFVHRYDASGRWVAAFGGPGEAAENLHTPHGIAVDRRTQPPTLLVADRENGKLKRFDLAGEFLGVVCEDLRRPCGIAFFGELAAIPDLAGRVSLLDGENRVLEQLFDNPDPRLRATNQVGRELWKEGQFLAPHAAVFDAAGNLFVQDWSIHGRVTRLERKEQDGH